MPSPCVIVHSLDHAAAALEAAAAAGRTVTLLSAPGAGIYAGPAWFKALAAAARAAVPAARCAAALDCGDDAGAAQAAIRAGVEAIVFTGPAEVGARLAAIAEARGIRLFTARPEAQLDLGALAFADAAALRQACRILST